jgi:hypothetical protein
MGKRHTCGRASFGLPANSCPSKAWYGIIWAANECGEAQ